VTVFSATNGGDAAGAAAIPDVMLAPVRPDLVRYVHTNTQKNFRQAHGVKYEAGYETSAESWGTGRAVARIPRVAGGGTHRSGQGAFGNMCRGGGMFNPKRTWRRWNRKINLTERRHAMASAIAATAVPGLVMARGHKIDEVRELPIVVSDEVQDFVKTKQAKTLLTQIGCKGDLDRAEASVHIRKGKGKWRNRRYVCRRGPLLVYAESNGCHSAFRGIPGVDMLNVEALNLLKVAPGGTMGRLVVWTESALKKLDELFGQYKSGTSSYKEYTLPRAVMTNADLSRIINSAEVQSAVNPAKEAPKTFVLPHNPLTNRRAMDKLNPAAQSSRKRTRLAATPGKSEHEFVKGKRDALVPAIKAAKKLRKQQVQAENDEVWKKVKAVKEKTASDDEE